MKDRTMRCEPGDRLNSLRHVPARRSAGWRGLICAGLLLAAGTSAFAESLVVESKKDDLYQVSVRAGSATGTTSEGDYEVVDADGRLITEIYPYELLIDRFWSQPLSARVYVEITTGMEVRAASLTEPAHSRLRREAEVRRKELQPAFERAKRVAVLQELYKLETKRDELIAKHDEAEARVAAKQLALAEARAEVDRVRDREQSDIERYFEEIDMLSDRREELQRQRDFLVMQKPFPQNEVYRITAEVASLNPQVDMLRRSIRIARDRQLSANSPERRYQEEWLAIIRERDEIRQQLRQVESRIRKLERQIFIRASEAESGSPANYER